jgi:hypothetical protein
MVSQLDSVNFVAKNLEKKLPRKRHNGIFVAKKFNVLVTKNKHWMECIR